MGFVADGAIMLKLDRHARAAEVEAALLKSPALAQLRPPWTGGARFLFPCTEGQYEEAREAGMQELTH